MFYFSAPLFWYKLIFAAELMTAEILATYTLKKRKHFAVRAALSIAVVFAAAFFFPLFFVNPIVNTVSASVMFLSLFGITVVAMKFCYDEKFVTLFFCGVTAYTTQHISYSTYSYLAAVTETGSFDMYGDVGFSSQTNGVFTALIYFIVYGAVYWFVWAFVEHRIREQERLKIDNLLIFSFAGILFVDIVLSMVVTYLMEDLSKIGLTVVYLYRLSSCVFIYVTLYSALGKRLAESELETVKSLWRQDRKSYELSKQNIELINIKCHDLKHQIRKLKGMSDGVIDENYLSALENSVSIYDNSLHTGNQPLDLILTENSVFMANYDIRLSVIADGTQLSFLSDSDVYSLFGNALHNAMEAVSAIEDKEKRIVRLRVRREAKMVVVHMENYCNEIIFDEKGLPKTQKKEKGHGYGMKSMKLIAEKYGGFLTATADDGFFCLDVIFPRDVETAKKDKEERKKK